MTKCMILSTMKQLRKKARLIELARQCYIGELTQPFDRKSREGQVGQVVEGLSKAIG
jgi:hypothetical protein